MRTRRFRPGIILTYAILILVSTVLLYPLIFMLLGSFVTIEEYARVRFIPIPSSISLDQYFSVLKDILPSVRITVIRVIWYITLALGVALFGGYVFSRLRFPGAISSSCSSSPAWSCRPS